MGRIKLLPEERREHYREYQRQYRLAHGQELREYRNQYNKSKKPIVSNLKELPKYSELANEAELDRFNFLMNQCKQLRLTGSL